MHYHAELGNESKAINKILRGWVMENKWKTTSLAELGVELIDCDHKTPKAVENGVPYIGIPQMDKGAINFEAKPRLISEEDYVTWTRKANPKFGDVILSRRCNSGETVYVPQGVKFALGQNLVLLRPTGERLHPEYLRWAVQGTEWWNEVAKYLNPGSIFESLKCREIPKFQIPEPPKSQQVKICDMLSSISDKIELNKEANQTLEQMAQTLFKSWFVDFDPVFDNLLAKIDFDLSKLPTDFPEFLQKRVEKRLHALNSTETGRATLAKLQNSSVFANNTNANKDASSVLDNNIHQHFPSEFEFNEQLGWVPMGWGAGSLSSVAKFTSDRIQGDLLTLDNYISTDNMNANKSGVTKASKLPEMKTAPAYHAGHILVSNIRPYFKKIWFAVSSGGRSNDVLGFEAIEPKNKEYIFNSSFGVHIR